jgi:hypothetical protein
MSYENSIETTERLDAWLLRPDYVQGLRLYAELVGENVLYKTMLRGQNSFNIRKLREALMAARDQLKTTASQQIIQEPRNVADLRRNAGALMNERTALKAQIRLLTDEEQRRTRAYRVLDICEELDKIYGQIEFFEINGTSWEPPTETNSDDSLVRRYLNLRTYISRTDKALNVAILPDKKAALKETLMKLLEEKKHLELTEEVKKYNGHAV